MRNILKEALIYSFYATIRAAQRVLPCSYMEKLPAGWFFSIDKGVQ
jgi:hypothetical protein